VNTKEEQNFPTWILYSTFKIIPKADPKYPYFLKDILDILDQGLKYILAKLKSFFPENQTP